MAQETAGEIDRHFNDEDSRWVRHSGTGRVLVFFHGLLSDGDRAWATRDSDWMDLIQEDPAFEGYDLFLANWYTSLLSADYDLNDSADSVLWDLSKPKAGQEPVLASGRIVMVCHSMGGLVARLLLVRSPEILASSQVSVLTLGTPARGAAVADLVAPLARSIGQEQLLDIRTDSDKLDELHVLFKALVEAHPTSLDGREFVESELLPARGRVKRFLHRWRLTPRPLVPLEAQGGYFGKPVVLAGTNHRTISRPDSLTHVSHVALKAFVADRCGTAED